jgi:hypothetical protein
MGMGAHASATKFCFSIKTDLCPKKQDIGCVLAERSGFVREPGREKQASTNEERDTLERATENYFGCRWQPRRPGAPFFASGGFCVCILHYGFVGRSFPSADCR